MRKTILTAAAATGLATLALTGLTAQDATTPGKMDVSRVTAGTYATDPGHSLVQWSVDHFGFNPYFGIFGDVAGTLTLDLAAIENATVNVQIPIASVAVPSAGLRDHLLRPGKDGGEPDFFGAEPGMARFVSTEVTQLGATRALIEGNLTMNGQTGPVVLLTEFSGAGANSMSEAETVGFTATTTIDRSNWGIGYGIPMVSDAVDLKISVAFEKQ
jgi:polyisoprenoid-binding protein YceI